MRLSSQISELQNQNAQLIEDHTRDVLQVKAKETQLVRARSDHETAEDRANGLSREIDRLKREITRLSRSQGGRDSPVDGMSGGGHGMLGNGSTPRPAYGSSRSSYNMPPPRTYSGEGHHYGGNSGDGKENMPDYEHGYDNGGKPSSGLSGRPMSNASSGRATPNGDEHGRPASYSNNGAPPQSSMSRNPSAGGDGVESWKRAAEVTQNLKARIEMMKVRSRPVMER